MTRTGLRGSLPGGLSAVLAGVGLVILPTLAMAQGARDDCAARLAYTLAEMLQRPLLKEEHATGLMWLRLDAQEALATGDIAGCLARVEAAEALLGMTPQEAQAE